MLHLISDYVRFVQGELTFAPYFLLGACLYDATLGAWPAGLEAIPCFIAMALHFIKYTQGRMPLDAALDNLWVATVWFPTAMVALLPGVIIVLSRVHPGQRFHSVDKWLGDLSYPIYLNHYAVLIVIASSQPSPSWAVMGFAIVGTALLSWLASQLVETPLQPVRDRIRREKL
jgi:peptidoglycan/LPS O-acetylase OafA/YrhL